MKKLAEEATIENVLESIKKNKFNRTQDVIDFIMALEQIEGNMFISLDAKWGSGKTFYVRQIEQTLIYLTKRFKRLDIENDFAEAFSNSPLSKINLDYTYLPIYYNAWLYDNHVDPLMSLMLIVTKEYKEYCGSKLKIGSFTDKVAELLDFTSISISGVQIGGNFRNIKEAMQGKDILSEVKTEDEIRDKVKEIFDSIIVENVQKLVIFIDELDRCRPSFAIEMLERIKHYLDDDRIIFIASVNREQLIHSISKYYGTNFDSTGYLDKFFDRNVYLPEIDTRFAEGLGLSFTNRQYHLENVASGLNDYYKLTLRENIRYYEYISFAASSNYVNDNGYRGFMFSAFIPIIAILGIKDENKKKMFLSGESDILAELFENVPALRELACRFGEERGKQKEDEEKFQMGFEKIKEAYDYSFGTKKMKWHEGIIEVDENFKDLCLRICSGLGVKQ